MTSIINTMKKSEIQIRALYENPGLNNKQVALVCREILGPLAGDLGAKTVAWYRNKAKRVAQGETNVPGMGKDLVALVLSYGTMVPNGMGAHAVTRAAPVVRISNEEAIQLLIARGYSVVAPEPEVECPKLDLGF